MNPHRARTTKWYYLSTNIAGTIYTTVVGHVHLMGNGNSVARGGGGGGGGSSPLSGTEQRGAVPALRIFSEEGGRMSAICKHW